MIIFGMRTKHTKSSVEDILKNSCPQCGGNLELFDLKKWFTLYFIPVFPCGKIESFYKCDKCEQTYKEKIKNMLISSKKDKEKVKTEVQKIFATTLAACMTHMAKIDGEISKEEKEELKNLTKNCPEFKTEIEKTIDKISKSKNDEAVLGMLGKARTILTAEGVILVVSQVARVLLADGKIDKKEEKLMKEYLLVCGIPRNLYGEIIEKVKKNM